MKTKNKNTFHPTEVICPILRAKADLRDIKTSSKVSIHHVGDSKTARKSSKTKFSISFLGGNLRG